MDARAGTAAPRAFAGAWLGLYIAAAAALVVASSISPSPFLPPLPEGVTPPGWLASVARSAGLDQLSHADASLRAGLIVGVCGVAFLVLCALAHAGLLSVRTVITASIALIVVVTILPPLLSRDLYSYAMYGRIWVEGANPYVDTPIEFPDEAFFDVTSPEWFRSPSVYGPAFTMVSAAIVGTIGSTAAVVLAFKLVAAAAMVATVLLVARLADRAGGARTALAVTAVGLNPVLLFHTVGGGHNDVLVGVALVAAVALWPRRPLAATAALTLGTLVKLVAVVPLALAIGVVFLRAPGGFLHRLRAALPHAALAAGTSVALFVPFGLSGRVLDAFATLASRLGWASPVRFVSAKSRDAATNLFGPEPIPDVVATLVQAAFALLALWVLIVILRGAARDGGLTPAEAWGWGLLVVSLCGAYLLPWYAAWFVPVVVLSRRPVTVLVAIGASALLALGPVPAEPTYAYRTWEAMVLAVHYVVAPTLLAFLGATLVEVIRSRLNPSP